MNRQKLVVHLSGGLGNQLFQISTGISLSQINNRTLLLNTNLYKNPLIRGRINSDYQKKRKFEAHHFKSVSSISLDKSLTPIDGNFEKLVSKFSRKQRRLLGIATEENYSVNGWRDACEIGRLVGHFTNPKFFKDINVKDLYRELSHELNDWSVKTINRIRLENLICVHVRLGDYLLQNDIVIPKERYYLEGLDIITSLLGRDRKAILFSDQPNLISSHFSKLSKEVEIARPPSNLGPAEILHVMSQCFGFVCSNSTYSWWATKLSQVKSDLIVAPKVYHFKTQESDPSSNFWHEQVKLVD